MTTKPDDAQDLTEQTAVELTWIGHATVLVQAPGGRLLTDPLLTRRVAHLRRRTSLPLPHVNNVDLVLVSHVHMDHFHVPSLKKVSRSANLICPRGARKLAAKAGFERVIELEAGDESSDPPFKINATNAVHKAGRGPHTKLEAPPVGFVIEASGKRIYFPGDTDLFDEMAELGPIDVALLPIWGWGSTLGHGHLDPQRAAEATAVIQPRWVIPIHWGTYAPEDGRRRTPEFAVRPAEQFRQELEKVGEADRLRRLAPGSSFRLTDD